MRLILPLATLALLALPVIAQTPPLPQQRPAAESPAEAAPPAAPEPPAAAEVPLPRERPAGEPDAPETAAPVEPAEPAGAEGQPAREAAPPRVYQTACPAVIMGLVEAKTLPPIEAPQCGEHSPLEVTGVLANGRMVKLSSPATLTCEMASALPGWVEDVDGYVFARDNTRVETLTVGTSYMCRNVNNAEGGRLSEHAFANGLDVVGFALEDGRSIAVESGWRGTEAQGSRVLRFAHDAACSRFMTTLGPEANALHRDHLHIDMGCHGKSCSARLCE